MIDPIDAVTPGEWEELRAYLSARYAGVFSSEAIEAHIRDYVGFTFPDNIIGMVLATAPEGARVLDIGSGFGGFVLRARDLGMDARGVEIAEREVKFARRRLARLRPDDDPEDVYRQGDARGLDVPPGSQDVVTAWNVLEHMHEYESVLVGAFDMLRPGGALYIVCPNYAAFRQEAHYHVPWYPLMPRALASKRLRKLGRDPTYFENEIFYRTNVGVIRTLSRIGFEPYSLDNARSMQLTLSNILRRPFDVLRFHNPFRESVLVVGRKAIT